SYDTEKTILSIIELLGSVSGEKEEDIPVVARVKEIISESIGEDISTSEIADKIGISLHYMCHLFKKSTGITVTEYKNSVKIAEAKRILVTTDEKITDIAMKCGFGSVSYFCKIFIASEKVSPAQYRKLLKNSGKKDVDAILCSMLPHVSFLDGVDTELLSLRDDVPMYEVTMPDEEYGFLHEAAIIAFKDRLFAAWYNNGKLELYGTTPIRFATSDDGGRTWSKPVTVAVDESGKILYCPPVFAVEDGKLYMFLNQMVKADHMHSFDLYIYNEEKNQFEELWSRPIPFKLNTNVYKLPNGKLIHPGRISHELDTFPNTPAVMISDSGKVDADWRLVKIQENGNLPDGAAYCHPELSLVVCGDVLYGFCRNDYRDVPVVYISEDFGESWSMPNFHDIPLSSSKIYSGTLSDGRNYIVGNIRCQSDPSSHVRDKLAIFFSRKGEMKFDKGFLLQNNKCREEKFFGMWHYPCCYEHDGKLYVIYSANTGDGNTRGAVVSVIDLNEI
ncbi:MAG: exo-alpha-sialidase, partial [Clostridia bacterium]|nr:exo-alpha-sialidase [Clostridia bacterium]